MEETFIISKKDWDSFKQLENLLLSKDEETRLLGNTLFKHHSFIVNGIFKSLYFPREINSMEERYNDIQKWLERKNLLIYYKSVEAFFSRLDNLEKRVTVNLLEKEDIIILIKIRYSPSKNKKDLENFYKSNTYKNLKSVENLACIDNYKIHYHIEKWFSKNIYHIVYLLLSNKVFFYPIPIEIK